jgi:hypothetical protein
VTERESSEPTTPEAPWLDAHLGVYLRDSSLWPVAIAACAIAVTLGAALLAATVLSGNPVLWGATGILVLISVDVLQRELRTRRRLGVASGLLLGWWVASAVAGALARAFGWF